MQGLCWAELRCRQRRRQTADQGVGRNVNHLFNICFVPAKLIATSDADCQPMAHILLVEDDADVQTVVSEFLATIGHRVISAASAEQARLFLENEAFELALVDCLRNTHRGWVSRRS